MTRDKVESYSGTQDHDQDYGAKQEGDKSGSPIGSLLRGLRDAKGIDEGVRDKEERFHSVPAAYSGSTPDPCRMGRWYQLSDVPFSCIQ
jgi:hypothetical protein